MILLVIIVAAIVLLALVIKSASAKEKKVFELMKLKGTAVAVTKENKPEMDQILNTVLKPLETYVNGPDQSMRGRHNFTPFHYVRLPNGFLFDVWVQIGYTDKRTQSVLHVVEFVDNAITHVVKADDYVKNSGTFDGLANATYENTNPK